MPRDDYFDSPFPYDEYDNDIILTQSWKLDARTRTHFQRIEFNFDILEGDDEGAALVGAVRDLMHGYLVRKGVLKVEPAEKPLHEVLNDSLRGMGRSERVQPVDDECCLACEARSLGLTVCRKRRCGCDHA